MRRPFRWEPATTLTPRPFREPLRRLSFRTTLRSSPRIPLLWPPPSRSVPATMLTRRPFPARPRLPRRCMTARPTWLRRPRPRCRKSPRRFRRKLRTSLPRRRRTPSRSVSLLSPSPCLAMTTILILALPEAATAGAAVLAGAGAAAAGLASAGHSAANALENASGLSTSTTENRAPINDVASGPIPRSVTEEPKSPEATPLTGSAATGVKSVPTLPSDAAIAQAAGGSRDSTTLAAPKYDEHTAVVAKDAEPVAPTVPIGAGDNAHTTTIPGQTSVSSATVPEHTAVVAKEAAPVGPETPIGAGDNAHTTTIPGAAESAPPADEHTPVQGFIAPKENPEDQHLYHAGAAALGAAVAGAALLGEKLVGAVQPHAEHAKELGQQGLQNASQTGASYLERAKQEAEHLRQQAEQLREQAAAEASRRYQEADKLAHDAVAAAQEKAAAAQAAVTGALSRGQEQVQQNATHYQAVATGKTVDGAPNANITPLPVSEAPAADRSGVSTSKEGPTVPGAEITSLPASEAPVAGQGSDALPSEANAVVPAQPSSASSSGAPTSAPPASEPPNLPASEITPLPASEAPLAEKNVTHAFDDHPAAKVAAAAAGVASLAAGAGVAGFASAAPSYTRAASSTLTQGSLASPPSSNTPAVEVPHKVLETTPASDLSANRTSWAQSQLSNAATTPPLGVTRTSSSYATSALTPSQEAARAAPGTESYAEAAAPSAGGSTSGNAQGARDAATTGAVRSSTYAVPDRSTYEGGSLSPSAMKRASNADLPPPVAEASPPLASRTSSEKALPRAPSSQTKPGPALKEEDTYVAHAGAPSTIPAPSQPSTPSKREEQFTTAPTTPASATVVGRHGGVTEPTGSASSSAPASPSVASDSGREGGKKRGFFSRFLKKDKQ